MDELFELLATEEPEVQIDALEKLICIVADISSAVVAALESGPNRFLLAERMVGIGTACVNDLKKVLNTSKSSEARELSALALEKLGVHGDPSFLMDMIRDDSEYALLAVKALILREATELVPLIVSKLETIDISNTDMIVSYLAALKELDGWPSESFFSKAFDEQAPRQVRRIVNEDFS